MKQIEPPWHSPTLCGCWIEKTHTWSIPQKRIDRIKSLSSTQEINDLWLARLEGQGYFEEVRTTYETIKRCKEHAHILDDTELALELHRFTGNAMRPSSCKCSLYYWFESALPSSDRIHYPLEHPVYTNPCKFHEGLDAKEQYHAVLSEMKSIGAIISRVAATLGKQESEIPYKLDEERNIVIDSDVLGYPDYYIQALIDGTAAEIPSGEDERLLREIIANTKPYWTTNEVVLMPAVEMIGYR